MDGVEVESLLKMADKALYEAKGAGRDRVYLYSGPELDFDIDDADSGDL